VVTVLGLGRVDITGRVLGVLLCAEIAVTAVILSFRVIWHCDLRCLVEDSVVNETSAA
jgi:hypothetical protein